MLDHSISGYVAERLWWPIQSRGDKERNHEIGRRRRGRLIGKGWLTCTPKTKTIQLGNMRDIDAGHEPDAQTISNAGGCPVS